MTERCSEIDKYPPAVIKVGTAATWHVFPTTFSHHILCFPAFHHGQVAVWSNGVFQAASPPALEEHHIPQEKQGGHIFTSQKRLE